MHTGKSKPLVMLTLANLTDKSVLRLLGLRDWCPPEAPLGCLGSHRLIIRVIVSPNTSVQLL